MATRNDITGDALISRLGNKEKFDENFSKIQPSCYPQCKELQGTMQKCRFCDWKVEK